MDYKWAFHWFLPSFETVYVSKSSLEMRHHHHHHHHPKKKKKVSFKDIRNPTFSVSLCYCITGDDVITGWLLMMMSLHIYDWWWCHQTLINADDILTCWSLMMNFMKSFSWGCLICTVKHGTVSVAIWWRPVELLLWFWTTSHGHVGEDRAVIPLRQGDALLRHVGADCWHCALWLHPWKAAVCAPLCPLHREHWCRQGKPNHHNGLLLHINILFIDWLR